MNVPVVLPIIRATVATDGSVAITLDDKSYAPHDGTGRATTRADLRQVVDQITREQRTPVRIEIIEADGTTYSDILTPPLPDQATDHATPHQHVGVPGISGSGFRPGERIALAYVLIHDTADDTGTTSVRLPAAVLTNRNASLLLIGLDSATITTIPPSPFAATAEVATA